MTGEELLRLINTIPEGWYGLGRLGGRWAVADNEGETVSTGETAETALLAFQPCKNCGVRIGNGSEAVLINGQYAHHICPQSENRYGGRLPDLQVKWPEVSR